MKKMLFCLLLIPAVSYAETTNVFSAEHGVGEDNINSVRTFSYEGIISDRLTASLSYVDLWYEDGFQYDSFEVDVDFAFGSFEKGSIYIGGGSVMPYNYKTYGRLDEIFESPKSPYDQLTSAINLGFSKRTGNSFDYDLGVAFVDNYKLYKASLRAPLAKSGFGFTYSLKKVENGSTTTSLGISYSL